MVHGFFRAVRVASVGVGDAIGVSVGIGRSVGEDVAIGTAFMRSLKLISGLGAVFGNSIGVGSGRGDMIPSDAYTDAVNSIELPMISIAIQRIYPS